jgi:double-strand break repair protein MRE11
MSDDDASATASTAGPTHPQVDHHVDEDTLRIMVSTDNHLGYAEKDPIRGNDSFAAFEEVLVLAKRHNVRLFSYI